MSERNWNNISAAGLITVIFALLGLAVIHSHEGDQRRVNQTANAEARYEEGGQYLTPKAGIPALSEKFAANPEPKTTQQKEERDLAAQESMAVWAYWMMVLSGFGVIITAIGTGFLVWQIDLTRKAVKDTGRATEAMQVANEIARHSMEANARPWLDISLVGDPQMDIIAGRPRIKARIRIENMGQSPAIKVGYFIALCIGYEPIQGALSAWKYRRKEVIGEIGDIFPSRHEERAAEAIHVGEPAEIERGFIAIVALYETAFSNEVRTSARFFEMQDKTSDDGLIDFSQPLSSQQLILHPYSEMAGLVD
jgi:hypothetical protein